MSEWSVTCLSHTSLFVSTRSFVTKGVCVVQTLLLAALYRFKILGREKILA